MDCVRNINKQNCILNINKEYVIFHLLFPIRIGIWLRGVLYFFLPVVSFVTTSVMLSNLTQI